MKFRLQRRDLGRLVVREADEPEPATACFVHRPLQILPPPSRA
jgi:hypothetical protein